jgi:hypothetical protein
MSEGRSMKSVITIALLLLTCGCVPLEDELPEVRARATPEPCAMPLPPPSPVLAVGTDPSHCVPPAVRDAGLDVFVQVSAEGRVTAVEDSTGPCVAVGRDGKVIPPHHLLAHEKQCMLDSLSNWRYAGATTCWPAYAYVSLGPGCCQAPAREK